MSEPITASEARQILDVLKELQGDMKSVKSDLQALTLEVRVNQAKDDEQFKALNDKIDELRDRQKTLDARLWAFIVALVTFIGGGLVKVLWFDRP